jgi:hypothetical protein
MSVSGSLRTMTLPELLQWLQYSKKTGTAIFERRGVVKKVFVQEGEIVSASSSDPRDYLGQILVCFGWLSEEQLKQAFQKQKTRKTLLGKILIEDFEVGAKHVLEALQIKIEETIYNLFLWKEGKFIFSDGLLGLSDHDRLQTSIPIEQVLFEGARRVDEWHEFRKSFPDDDVIFIRKLDKSELGPLGKDAIVQKIYREIDGRKSLQRILLDSHAPEYRGYEAFAKLFWGGHIQALPSSAQTSKPKVQASSDLLRAAELYKRSAFDEAHQVMENVLIENPENDEAKTLARAIQESLLKSLYQACPPEAVPQLMQDFSDLNEQVFSSQEGYLASRINGEWDVKSLIMISPLGELHSLRILKRLMDEGMIQFKKGA